MSKQFLKYLSFFILINVFLYLFISKFNGLVGFNRSYYNVAVHFYEDPRVNNKKFNFLKSTAVYDSQWYLEIAKSGYPKININSGLINFRKNEPHKYAFFPFYPFLLALINIPVKNLELTGILLSFFLLFLNFYLLYFFISSIDTKKIAIKTMLLLFFFPLSIFYRFIFSEGLFLTLLLLFTIFLFRKNFIFSAFFLGLALITRANAFPLILIFLYDFNQKHINLPLRIKILKFLKLIFIILFPLLIWAFYNYYQTGNLITFLKVRNFLPVKSFYDYVIAVTDPFLNNVYRIMEFPFLPLHAFADSKIEVLSVLSILYFLIKSKKFLDYRLWWITFSFWIFPLITTPLISYSRYQIVSFPIFYFLAKKFKDWQFIGIFWVFLVGLFILSLYFVNWYWLG